MQQPKRVFQELDQNIEVKRIKQQTRETSRLPLIKHVQKEIVPEHLKVLGEQLADLSAEVKVLIFEHLNYKDLSNLSIVCRSFRNIVIQHFVLNKKRLTVTFETMRTTNEEETFQTASDFGLLLKRSTFSYPVSERIELIRELFEMVRLKDQLRHIYKSDNASFKNLVKSVKFLFAKVIRGWKFKETLKLIEEFELHFDHHKLINTFLTQDYGAIRADEQYLRYFYRKIIFEGLDDNRCRAKWLAYFLDYHTNITSDPNIKMTFKGKLMLLLFSPVFQEPLSGVLYIDWYAYSSQFFIDDCLAYLGLAFKLLNLLNASSERRLDIVQLFRTVTNIGLHWLNENSSTLLHYCGANIAKQVVDWLLQREDYVHLVRYLTNLFIVEGNLVRSGKINSSQKITGSILDHLKESMNVLALENIVDMISIEFFSIALETERVGEDREYLGAVEVVLGQRQFYELLIQRERFNHLIIC